MAVRQYSRVECKCWEGDTFAELRKRGSKALLVGLFLMTSPRSNMIGIYKQPVMYMAYETGLGLEGAREGLQHCIEAAFCSYDEDTEMVWVHEMARYQIASMLDPADNRCKGVQREYDSVPKNPFLGEFFDRYAEAFHLTQRRENSDPRQRSLLSPADVPTSPLEAKNKSKNKNKNKENPSGSLSAAPTCPYANIVALYHELLPKAQFPRVRLLDDKRQKVIRECWVWILSSSKPDGSRRAETPEQAMEWLRRYLLLALENDFLMGRTPRDEQHRNWKPDIEYLLSMRGVKQVLEKTS